MELKYLHLKCRWSPFEIDRPELQILPVDDCQTTAPRRPVDVLDQESCWGDVIFDCRGSIWSYPRFLECEDIDAVIRDDIMDIIGAAGVEKLVGSN